jgi:hypothetical protein
MRNVPVSVEHPSGTREQGKRVKTSIVMREREGARERERERERERVRSRNKMIAAPDMPWESTERFGISSSLSSLLFSLSLLASSHGRTVLWGRGRKDGATTDAADDDLGPPDPRLGGVGGVGGVACFAPCVLPMVLMRVEVRWVHVFVVVDVCVCV